MSPATAPYGSWSSPITADELVTDVVTLQDPRYDGEDAYWVEQRPSEAGRCVLVRHRASGDVEDVLPEGFSARTRAHEYGGLCYAVQRGVVFFTNFEDQRLYRLDPGAAPRPLTDEPPTPQAWRYADPIVSPDGASLYCVRERHGEDGVDNELVVVDPQGALTPLVLADGHDFFAAPCPSPDGRRLAWIAWDHPQMPWDGTLLYEGVLDGRRLVDVRVVCGGPQESVLQPRYGRDGSLYFVSDRSGWWNLYRDRPEGPVALAPRSAEFAEPAWVFGQATYAPRGDGAVVAAWSLGSTSQLGLVSPEGRVSEIPLTWSFIESLDVSDDRTLLLAGSPTAPTSVVEVRLGDGSSTVLRASREASLDAAYLSEPQPIEFPTAGGQHAFAFYYPPTNPDFVAPADELPPLIVSSHGGPTSNCSTELNPKIQYWTSRGFAFVGVDYGGSTGYGRAYRERLRGQWGVVDLEDCVNAAHYLAATHRTDPERLLIHGGSAGGYTTLCALTFRDDFAAGASYFGVGDLSALARDTHKFESRYLDSMVGPWPETAALYEERSPIFHTDQLRTPVILFQGLEDHVVPPAQAEAMADALRENGVPFAYIAYEGEGHGFRRAENIVRTAEAELYFYGRVLGFTPADQVEPVDIENEDALH